jgi:prepilin-type N-terminal cleavage/methylation domain-containing protein
MAGRGAPGFTLTELVMVIAILAIITAVIVPRYNRTQTDAAWFGDEVRAAVRYAQKKAIQERQNVYVVVTSSDLSLCYDSACTNPLTRLVVTSNPSYKPAAGKFLAVPPNVTLSSSPSTFSFNGLGQPSSGATLNVSGRGITVYSETGYVL